MGSDLDRNSQHVHLKVVIGLSNIERGNGKPLGVRGDGSNYSWKSEKRRESPLMMLILPEERRSITGGRGRWISP